MVSEAVICDRACVNNYADSLCNGKGIEEATDTVLRGGDIVGLQSLANMRAFAKLDDFTWVARGLNLSLQLPPLLLLPWPVAKPMQRDVNIEYVKISHGVSVV